MGVVTSISRVVPFCRSFRSYRARRVELNHTPRDHDLTEGAPLAWSSSLFPAFPVCAEDSHGPSRLAQSSFRVTPRVFLSSPNSRALLPFFFSQMPGSLSCVTSRREGHPRCSRPSIFFFLFCSTPIRESSRIFVLLYLFFPVLRADLDSQRRIGFPQSAVMPKN